MPGWLSRSKGLVLLLIFLSACTTGDLTIGISPIGGSLTTPSSTKLPSSTPKETIDPSTPTLLPTVIPVGTPTEGPPPDLEILNTTIYYTGIGGGTLIGEIRNNTDTPMVFPNDYKTDTSNPILRITTEAWDWFGKQWGGGDHYYHEVSIGKGNIVSPNTNCFLYPGETGPIIVRSVSACYDFPKNCVNNHEEITDAPEGTGIRLVGYQDLKTYIPWPGLYPDYHPQVINVVYSVVDDGIEFSFDVQKSFFKGYGHRYLAWVFLYDKNGGIISILHHSQLEKIFQEKDDLYHISGHSRSSNLYSLREFRNSNEQIGLKWIWDFTQVDHVRVLVEAEHQFLCGMYTNYDYYRRDMEED